MSLFIPFKPHHPNAAKLQVKFQGEKEKPLARNQSSHSTHSTQSDPGSATGSKTPTPDHDSFKPSKRSRTAEELNVTTKAISEEGGEQVSDHRFSALDECDWLNKTEDDDFLELVARNLSKKQEKPTHPPAPPKPENHRNLGLTSHRLDEEGGFSITSYMVDHLDRTPRPEPKEASQGRSEKSDSQSSTLNSLFDEEMLKRTTKRKYKDFLG